MNKLSIYIQEKLKINSKSKINQYKYQPQDKDELEKLVKKLINERGDTADLNDIDVSKIINMEDLFLNSDFNGDISEWDVSNVEDMDFMFYNSDFNGDISGWDVSKVEHMKDMFLKSPLEKNPPKWYHE